MIEKHVTRAVSYVASRSVGSSIPGGCRVTLNFHPDSFCGPDLMMARLVKEGIYRSQFETGTSNGGLTAYVGGDRWNWESRIFGGVYDSAEPALRPKYGALNYKGWAIGGSPRFGSAHLRLREHVLERTTFCYPDSYRQPQDFGVASAMPLIEIAAANASRFDALDDYIEAQVHGMIELRIDVEAVVLDPCYRNTSIEQMARTLPCLVEWHQGFRLDRDLIGASTAYRGQEVTDLLTRLSVDGVVTPKEIGSARQTSVDPQHIKQAWHCVARFGSPVAY